MANFTSFCTYCVTESLTVPLFIPPIQDHTVFNENNLHYFVALITECREMAKGPLYCGFLLVNFIQISHRHVISAPCNF